MSGVCSTPSNHRAQRLPTSSPYKGRGQALYDRDPMLSSLPLPPRWPHGPTTASVLVIGHTDQAPGLACLHGPTRGIPRLHPALPPFLSSELTRQGVPDHCTPHPPDLLSPSAFVTTPNTTQSLAICSLSLGTEYTL